MNNFTDDEQFIARVEQIIDQRFQILINQQYQQWDMEKHINENNVENLQENNPEKFLIIQQINEQILEITQLNFEQTMKKQYEDLTNRLAICENSVRQLIDNEVQLINKSKQLKQRSRLITVDNVTRTSESCSPLKKINLPQQPLIDTKKIKDMEQNYYKLQDDIQSYIASLQSEFHQQVSQQEQKFERMISEILKIQDQTIKKQIQNPQSPNYKEQDKTTQVLESALNEIYYNINQSCEQQKNNNDILHNLKTELYKLEEQQDDIKTSQEEKIINIWQSIGFMNQRMLEIQEIIEKKQVKWFGI